MSVLSFLRGLVHRHQWRHVRTIKRIGLTDSETSVEKVAVSYCHGCNSNKRSLLHREVHPR